MKLRTILLGIAALFVASNAAYFSVLGLSKLFAGASTAIIIMGSSLELAKLISAAFLYNYWTTINKWLRTYLLIGVFVLIGITSVGIYGYLTSAYQTTSDQLSMLDKRIELVDTKKNRYQIQYNEYSVEKKSIQETIIELTKGLSNNVIQYIDKETGEIITTTSANTRRVLTTQLNENKDQRDKISEKMESLSDSITSLDIQALEIRATDVVAGEVGPLKYLAELTDLPMNIIVSWLALFIIFVFDPLAVTLIVAFNTALRVDKGEYKKKTIMENKYQIYEDSGKNLTETTKTVSLVEKICNKFKKSTDNKIVKTKKDAKIFFDSSKNPSKPNDDLKSAMKTYNEKDLNEGGWRNAYNGLPYYYNPKFDWNIFDRWIGDQTAVNYWIAHKNGNVDLIKKYKLNN